MSGRCLNHCPIKPSLTLALAAALVVLTAGTASAQGLFEALFGNVRRAPPRYQSYAPPSLPFFSQPQENRATRYASRGRQVFCVRLCDGRYFPIARHRGASAAEACNSFCPASGTKVFSGGDIKYARASDGTRYSDIENAFLYRKQVVNGCTCNGRSTFGLAQINTSDDPTLRKGDIVALRDGFVAYKGRERESGELKFTPIETYSSLGKRFRERLSETKVAPAASKLPITDVGPQAASFPDKRAQLVR